MTPPDRLDYIIGETGNGRGGTEPLACHPVRVMLRLGSRQTLLQCCKFA